MKATGAHGRYNGGFIRITAACDVTLYRTYRNTLVGDPMLLAKGAKGEAAEVYLDDHSYR